MTRLLLLVVVVVDVDGVVFERLRVTSDSWESLSVPFRRQSREHELNIQTCVDVAVSARCVPFRG